MTKRLMLILFLLVFINGCSFMTRQATSNPQPTTAATESARMMGVFFMPAPALSA